MPKTPGQAPVTLTYAEKDRLRRIEAVLASTELAEMASRQGLAFPARVLVAIAAAGDGSG
jgi:hypothetical protein